MVWLGADVEVEIGVEDLHGHGYGCRVEIKRPALWLLYCTEGESEERGAAGEFAKGKGSNE